VQEQSDLNPRPIQWGEEAWAQQARHQEERSNGEGLGANPATSYQGQQSNEQEEGSEGNAGKSIRGANDSRTPLKIFMGCDLELGHRTRAPAAIILGTGCNILGVLVAASHKQGNLGCRRRPPGAIPGRSTEGAATDCVGRGRCHCERPGLRAFIINDDAWSLQPAAAGSTPYPAELAALPRDGCPGRYSGGHCGEA
jgi:hypothetical protein